MPEPLPPFRTFREILRHVLSLHRDCLERYAAAVVDCEDARRVAVLQYLRACEAELLAALARYEQSDDEVLATFVQGVPAAPLAVATADRPAAGAPGDLDTLLDDYRRRSTALVQVYDQLAASLVGPRAREIFADLADLGRRSQMRLQQALLDF